MTAAAATLTRDGQDFVLSAKLPAKTRLEHLALQVVCTEPDIVTDEVSGEGVILTRVLYLFDALTEFAKLSRGALSATFPIPKPQLDPVIPHVATVFRIEPDGSLKQLAEASDGGR